VLVTPELVRPIPAGEAVPEIGFPRDDFLITNQAPRTPGLAVTGPVPVNPPANTIGVEQLLQSEEKLSAPGIFRNAPVAQPPTATPGGFAPFSTGASGGANAAAPATGAR
jgi:pilus assembly protein CpaC